MLNIKAAYNDVFDDEYSFSNFHHKKEFLVKKKKIQFLFLPAQALRCILAI